jgi:hypothetical protein
MVSRLGRARYGFPVDEATGQNRTRALVAAILAGGLLIAILIVVLAGSSGGDTAEAADAECIDAWNDDEAMIGFGQHQFNGHGYERVEVLRVTEEGEPTDSADGLCAVVFAARALDPEPGARAQVLVDDKWAGLESLGNVDEREIAKLQSDAFADVNASLTTDGRLAPAGS